jgi:hypothetical protein
LPRGFGFVAAAAEREDRHQERCHHAYSCEHLQQRFALVRDGLVEPLLVFPFLWGHVYLPPWLVLRCSAHQLPRRRSRSARANEKSHADVGCGT